MNDKMMINLSDKDSETLQLRGFQLGDVLKSGNLVHLYRATHNGSPIVAKVVPFPNGVRIPHIGDYQEYFLYDRYVSKNLKHENLIKIIDAFVVSSGRNEEMAFHWMFFMEFAEGGSLVDLLDERKRPLSEKRTRHYYRQFGDALRFMHSTGFEHGNIKCNKIVLDRNRRVCKLIDFSFTRKCFKNSTSCHLLKNSFCPSAAYAAPEVLLSGRKGKPQRPRSNPFLDQLNSDVWSCGVVVFTLLHYRLPFNDWNLRFWLQSQLEEKYHCDPKLSADVQDFISEHLNPDYNTRPTMEKMMEHHWLKKGHH